MLEDLQGPKSVASSGSQQRAELEKTLTTLYLGYLPHHLPVIMKQRLPDSLFDRIAKDQKQIINDTSHALIIPLVAGAIWV